MGESGLFPTIHFSVKMEEIWTIENCFQVRSTSLYGSDKYIYIYKF